MIFIHLDSLEIANKLVAICDQHRDYNIDIHHGRYTVDGRSLLGVCSLLGKIVKIEPVTTNENISTLANDLKEIGAWLEEGENDERSFV